MNASVCEGPLGRSETSEMDEEREPQYTLTARLLRVKPEADAVRR